MFAIRKVADMALLQANKTALLVLAAACVLFLAATIVLTVRAARREKARGAQSVPDAAAREETPPC